MRVDEVECPIFERQHLSVRHAQRRWQLLEPEVLAGQNDRRIRDVDAGGTGAAADEPHQIDTRATTHFEHAPAAVPVEVDEPQQVMELVEMVVIEIGKEPRRSDRMRRNLEIVDMLIPVTTDVGTGGGWGCRTVWHGRLL